MIKNIVFDMGQVLIQFKDECTIYPFVPVADRELVASVVLDREYWDALDIGAITDAEVVEKIKGRLPQRLWAAAEECYYGIVVNTPETEGMADLIRDVKARFGIKCYLLSNINQHFADNYQQSSILRLMDGCVFSAPLKMVKPQPEIYQHMLDKFAIDPKETVFVDDRIENVEAAEKFGIIGYVFDGDVEKLKAYFETILA